jgi:uncharacterized membrane protein YfcA
MIEAAFLAIAVVFSVLGMGWMALANPVHWQQVFPGQKKQPDTRWLRSFGWIALVMSAVSCLLADHPSMAVLVWVMLLALAAISVAMMLGYRPAWLRVLWPRQAADNTKTG